MPLAPWQNRQFLMPSRWRSVCCRLKSGFVSLGFSEFPLVDHSGNRYSLPGELSDQVHVFITCIAVGLHNAVAGADRRRFKCFKDAVQSLCTALSNRAFCFLGRNGDGWRQRYRATLVRG
jgi:hypothetical protein